MYEDLDNHVIMPRIIALDETEYYTIEEEDKPFISRILSVYFYDKNLHTHNCSFTPDYWLIHLYDQVCLTKAGEELDEYAQDRIFQRYEYSPTTDDCYMAVSDIDRVESQLTQSGEKFRFIVEPDEPVPEDVTYDEAMEALREEYCANCRI